MIAGRRCTTGSLCCTRTGSSSDSRTDPLRCRTRCRRRRPSGNQLYRKWINRTRMLLHVGLRLIAMHEHHKVKQPRVDIIKKLLLQSGSNNYYYWQSRFYENICWINEHNHCKIRSRYILFNVKTDQGRGEQSENDMGPGDVTRPMYCICNST